MIDLEHDLAHLGDRLALDDDGLVDDVLTRIVAPAPAEPAVPPRWLVAAAVLLAVVTTALAVPSSRRAIADWFGLDGVSIEQQPDLSVPADAIDQLPAGVTYDQFEGSLDDDLITKVLGAGTTIVRVDVGGLPGLWIDGEPHELVLRGADGGVTTRRFAGNTLLWQDGDTVRRVEGFASLDEALAFAAARHE
jgi:hypothetical protein